MQKIIPHLWFDKEAEEAVNLYVSIFKNSKVFNINHYGEAGADVSKMPKGSVMTVSFQLQGQEFIALNGGTEFTFTPAISFLVNCASIEELNKIWEKFSDGGIVLMELGKYPFSERFGWVQDRFGISWQLNLTSGKENIAPFLMFVGEQHGKAEEAMNFYISLFEQSSIMEIEHYGEDEENIKGTVKLSNFLLNGQEFMAIDSNFQHSFNFSEAISFFVNCETEKEVDELWSKFCEEGEEVQCGWLKDKYGISWQIVPAALGEILGGSDSEKSEKVMKAMFQMKKIDIKKLREIYESN